MVKMFIGHDCESLSDASKGLKDEPNLRMETGKARFVLGKVHNIAKRFAAMTKRFAGSSCRHSEVSGKTVS